MLMRSLSDHSFPCCRKPRQVTQCGSARLMHCAGRFVIRSANRVDRELVRLARAPAGHKNLWMLIFHNFEHARTPCRRPIEKSPLAQIQMSLSTLSVGEYWADDGDYDEPDGDRPDERIARSNGGQDQGNGGIDADGSWPASSVSLAKAYGRHGPEALVSRRRGRPSNRSYPSAWRVEVLGIIREHYRTSARRWRRRSWPSCTVFTLDARRYGNG